MKLRTRKRLLNLASASLFFIAGFLIAAALTATIPAVTRQASSAQQKSPSAASETEPTLTVDATDARWTRLLRRPLYDPPPPPQVIVKKKIRPVTVKLTGTILEGENSQAFLRRANGKVELKRVGDLVTDDPLDGQIEKITATSITIRREQDEIQLTVESPN